MRRKQDSRALQGDSNLQTFVYHDPLSFSPAPLPFGQRYTSVSEPRIKSAKDTNWREYWFSGVGSKYSEHPLISHGRYLHPLRIRFPFKKQSLSMSRELARSNHGRSQFIIDRDCFWLYISSFVTFGCPLPCFVV